MFKRMIDSIIALFKKEFDSLGGIKKYREKRKKELLKIARKDLADLYDQMPMQVSWRGTR